MTLSTALSRSRRSWGGGTSNGTWAAASVFLARGIRAWTVVVGVMNARAISSLVRPPSTRRVSATLDSRESTGWQEMKTRARTSSSGRRSRSGLAGVQLGRHGGVPLVEGGLPPEGVDRSSPTDRHQPRRRVAGYAVARPRDQRLGQRLLRQVVGTREV